jgi:molecular chaperone GrpE (heat shock protein)
VLTFSNTPRTRTSSFHLPTFSTYSSTTTVVRMTSEEKDDKSSSSSNKEDDDEAEQKKDQEPHATEDHAHPEGAIPDDESLVLSAHQEDEEEDEEIKALKEEIAALEATLHNKRMECSRLEDMVEDFSETGYLRQCADMENTRKRSASSHQTSKYISRASVLQRHFLPILEEMSTLQEKYASTPNGKSYDTLRSDMMLALQKKIDVTAFDSPVGKEVNKQRDAIVGYEVSDTVPKGYVLRAVKSGLEVHGNIICPAQCIVSQGAAVKEEEAAEGETVEVDATAATNEDKEVGKEE